MDIRILRYFVQVAKDKNFTKAAEHLYISQPALSKMIKKLEQELGVSLVEIRSGGVFLTDYGQELYQRAVPMIAQFDSLTNFIERRGEMPSGLLRIGVTPMLATLYMVNIVTHFNNQWPNVEFRIVEDGSITLRKSLLAGDLDLVLCITGDVVPGLQDTILFEEEMVAVVSTENPLSQFEALDFTQLAHEPFNLYSQYASLYRQIVERCIKAGFEPKINITSSKVNFMLQMTEHNRGICILPRPYAVRGARSNLKIIPFIEKFPWQGCIVRNKTVYQPQISSLFEKFVLSYFKSNVHSYDSLQ